MKNSFVLLALFLILSCEAGSKKNIKVPLVIIEKTDFGKTKTGFKVDKYTLKNQNGMEISAINLGGIITSLKAADREGNYEDVVLGFNNVSQYEEESPYFGAIIGRYANRIANGKFTINQEEFILAKNNGENHLHGGLKGFDKVLWDVAEIVSDSTSSLVFTYTSKDMAVSYTHLTLPTNTTV